MIKGKINKTSNKVTIGSDDTVPVIRRSDRSNEIAKLKFQIQNLEAQLVYERDAKEAFCNAVEIASKQIIELHTLIDMESKARELLEDALFLLKGGS